MQRLEVSGAVRPIYGSLGVKGLMSEPLLCKQSAQREAENDEDIRSCRRFLSTPQALCDFF